MEIETKVMNTKSWFAVELAVLLFASSASAAEPSASQPSFDTVVKVTAVTNRDASGRAQRFTDAGNREFAVRYDAQQRVQSVEATRGPHISDVVSVRYGADGRLIGVRFRSGYSLFFDHRLNGAQVIRDSSGAVMGRDSGSASLREVDGTTSTDKLASTVTEFESLMKSLKQGSR